jgi:hypothetical protein
MFLLILPTIATAMEERLREMPVKDESKPLTRTVMKKILEEELFQKEFLELDKNDFNELIGRQVDHFKAILIAETKEQLGTYETDDLLVKLSRISVGAIKSIKPTINSLEDTIIAGRREMRMNKDWLGTEYRPLSEKLLLQFEELPIEKISIFLSEFRKKLEVIEIDIEDSRRSEVIKLVYEDSSFHEVKRDTIISEALAILKIDQETQKATLTYSKDATLIDKRTAQRQADSITRTGFEMTDKRRIGMNCQLEVQDP